LAQVGLGAELRPCVGLATKDALEELRGFFVQW